MANESATESLLRSEIKSFRVWELKNILRAVGQYNGGLKDSLVSAIMNYLRAQSTTKNYQLFLQSIAPYKFVLDFLTWSARIVSDIKTILLQPNLFGAAATVPTQPLSFSYPMPMNGYFNGCLNISNRPLSGVVPAQAAKRPRTETSFPIHVFETEVKCLSVFNVNGVSYTRT